MQEEKQCLKEGMAKANQLPQSIQEERQQFQNQKRKEYASAEDKTNKVAEREAESKTKEYLKLAEMTNLQSSSHNYQTRDNIHYMLSKKYQEVVKRQQR